MMKSKLESIGHGCAVAMLHTVCWGVVICAADLVQSAPLQDRLALPPAYELNEIVGFYANRDVMVSAIRELEPSKADGSFGRLELSIWRIPATGQPMLLETRPHWRRKDGSRPDSFVHLSSSPSGRVVACRERWEQDSSVPQSQWVFWEPGKSEPVALPDDITHAIWIDDHRLLVRRRNRPSKVGLPAELAVLNTESMEIEQVIPTGGVVLGQQHVAPGVVAYLAGPDPERPEPWQRFWSEYAVASYLATLDPHLSAHLRGIVCRRWEESDAQRDEGGAIAGTGGTIDRWEPPVIPVDTPDFAVGELRLLDCRDPRHPRTRVLMDLFPSGAGWTVSPDARYVAYNRRKADMTQDGFVVYDTVTGGWRRVGPWVPRPRWDPLTNGILALTHGPVIQSRLLDEQQLQLQSLAAPLLDLAQVVGVPLDSRGNGVVAPPPNQGQPAGAASQPSESLWEAYTRRFIEKYKLDREQAERAWTICRDCQEQAQRYVAAHRQELDELTRRLAAAPESRPAGGDAKRQLDLSRRLDENEALAREKQRLLRPIDEIFEKQLKPRLDKLPTRAQREAAERASGDDAASQPASVSPSRPPGSAR